MTTQATRTRKITSLMDTIKREYARRNHDANVSCRVELSRRYNRRRYMLTYESVSFIGHTVLYDATRGEIWIRPLSREHGHIGHTALEWAGAESLLLDAMLDIALSTAPGSLTRESLKEWRETRKPQA